MKQNKQKSEKEKIIKFFRELNQFKTLKEQMDYTLFNYPTLR